MGVDLWVVWMDGVDVWLGEIGEIWLKVGSMMFGYFDDVVVMCVVFVLDGWYCIGDVVWID